MRLLTSLRRITGSAIIKAYLTSVLGVFSGLLTQLVFVKALTESVSSRDFSLYGFMFQIVSYFAIFQLGLDFATAREIALNLGKGNKHMANYAYWFIKRFNVGIIVIAIAILGIITVLFYNEWGLQQGYDHITAIFLVLLFGSSQIITFSLIPNTAALIGTNLQYITNLNNVVVSILSTLTGYLLLLQFNLGIYALPVAMIFVGLCNIVFLKWIVQKKCDWLKARPLNKNKEIEKRTIRFSLVTTLGGLAWTIEATSDVIILNANGLLQLVGIYIIWWRFPQMLFDLVTRFTTSATPGFTIAYGRSIEESNRLFRKVFLLVAGGALVVFTGIILWLPSFIEIWIGKKEYIYANAKLLSLLMAILVFLRILGNCMGMYLISIGKIKLTTRLSWLQAIIKISLAVLLVKHFSIEGIFIASAVSALMQVTVLIGYLMYYKVIASRMIIWLFFVGAICSASFYLTPSETNLWLFLIKGTLTVLAVATVWIIFIRLFGYQKVFGSEFTKKRKSSNVFTT